MTKTNLGRVAMRPAGVWNAMTQYHRLDVVEDSGGSYFAIIDNINTSTLNTSVWQKIADRGPKGEGNVTVLSENELVAGEKYVFIPNEDRKAMGSFVPFEETIQIPSDWNQSDANAIDFIKNKPAIPDKLSDLVNDNSFQTGEQLINAISIHNQSEIAHEDLRTEVASLQLNIEGLELQMDNESYFRGYVSTTTAVLSLNATINDYAYNAETGTKWLYTDNGWEDSGDTVPDQKVPKSNIIPLMDGIASVGNENAYAPGDHRHPTDITRASIEDLNNLIPTEQSIILAFITGSKTISSLSSMVLDKQIIYSAISSNQTISVDSRIVDGQPSHIYVHNTGTVACTITIPTTGSYVSMSGASKVLPASGYLEISIAYDTLINKYRITILESE